MISERTGDAGTNKLKREKIARIRHDEAVEGAKILGTKLIFLDFNDQFLLDTEETGLAILDALRTIKPDLIFALNPKRYNQF